MPNYRSWFPSKYVCAEDLQGEVVPVTIARIELEEMPNGDGERKPVLYFGGYHKGMVLNKTNAKRIAQMYGSDTDGWIGHEILIYPSEADLRGETVPCIRVKLIEQATPSVPPKPVPNLQLQNKVDDQQQPAPQQPPAGPSF